MKNRCVIIGAAPEANPQLLKDCINSNDFIICADGGLIAAKKAEIIPDLLIGDFDSLGFVPDENCETVILPVKKDDTDSMYCAREGLKRGYDDFLLLGMTGGRLDHSYSNLCVLLFLEKNGAHAQMCDLHHRIRVMTEGKMAVTEKNGSLFSIFPFGCESCTVSLDGFEYPLSEYRLSADNSLGLSNVIRSDEALVTVHSGYAVVIMCDQH